MFKYTTRVLAIASLTLAPLAPTAAQDPGTMLPPPSESGYAPVNGVEVYYSVYGTGEPLVLLHGGLMTTEMFGPVLTALAEGRQVIGIELQAHGHTLPFDRPMSWDALATDVAEVIRYLGHEDADVMGYSLGGGVALRTAIDHPDVVDQLVVVSAPYAFSGWHDFNRQGMRAMGPELAEGMVGTPLHQAYVQAAPDPENFPRLLEQMGEFIGEDYDWSADIDGIEAPTLLVVADHDSVRISHATAFFELLGGGQADGGWDGAGMTPNRFAVIPDATHYTIGADPRLGETVIRFLDAKE
ncbi:alpha/beta fold hydrolase [Pelagibacterium xiamenense]|uniref:alpha/beta fold hydrolase n=1 Tax=Pelagibacterium xiamenense TaxID=2901140 RepID=UPI001E5E263D|nr:alpha/beta hydrolase [Pelagibacterium xiamenense]MCD7059267.1 alpha/beta hydrolase [Pelagibacterium xiamenense]